MDKENYFLRVNFVVEDVEIPDVLCRIFLPERVLDKPHMRLEPTEEQFEKLNRSYKGNFKVEIKSRDDICSEIIESSVVYLENTKATYRKEGISEFAVDGKPQNLTVIRFRTTTDGEEKSSVIFWISPNKMLSPVISHIDSYDGSIKIKRHFSFEFPIADNIKLKFDEHYRNKKTGNKDMLRWSFLVSCVELNIFAHDITKIRAEVLPIIDDFLLIASFASRTRTACLGFDAVSLNVNSSYYRGDLTFPNGESEFNFNDGLVAKQDFEEFMNHCYSTFSKYPNKKVLQRAIWALVPGEPKTLEENFLLLFAGIETLLLEYRRQENLEFVIWQQIKNHIRDSIKSISNPKTEKKQRCYMYEKIDELNRISLRNVLDDFCERFDLEITDLWPIFAAKNQVGLSDIRNRLIHGETFDDECFDAIGVACDNLKWLLERMILKILDWPIDRSEVEAEFLKHNSYSLSIMPAERERIAQIFYNTNN